jgi:hypothetical protein
MRLPAKRHLRTGDSIQDAAAAMNVPQLPPDVLLLIAHMAL